jgi:predicted dehydrogenase
LIAISDVDERRINYAKQHFHVPFSYTSYKDLLARNDVDAVVICTPPAHHADIAVEAARRGKHIFCEKPLAMTTADCEAMIDAAQRAGVVLQVGYMLRFSSDREHIASAVRSGRLGSPIFYREIVNLSAGGPQTWIPDQKTGGGPLFEASHIIDYARYLFGDPDYVYGIGGHFKPNKISANDTYAASLIYGNGNRALICDSYALKNFGWEQIQCRLHRVEIDMTGPGGYIQFPDSDLSQKLTICTYAEPKDDIQKIQWTSNWGANGYRTELEHFMECIQQKKKPAMDGYEGLRTLQLCEAIHRSIQTGEVCKVPAAAGSALVGSHK